MLKENIENRIIHLLSKCEFRFKKLSHYFGCKSRIDKLYLENILEKMQIQGLIYFNEGIYQLFPKKFLITTIEEMNHKKEGHTACFKNAKNVLIPIKEQNLNGAMVGDIVVLDEKNRMVQKILKRKINHIHCEVILEDSIKKLKPLRVLGSDYLNVRIAHRDMKKLIPGEIILVELTVDKYDSYYEGNMIDFVGHKDDPDIALNIIASNHGFLLNHSKEALEEAYKIPTKVEEKDRIGRLDLRQEEIFTIDGIYTKDMDDAVGLKELSNGNYELSVSIADVNHYIKPSSHLWNEAKERSTSLYMVNSVIPMFPHILSNGICSLNESEDRLALTCFITLNNEGKILEYKVLPTVINSKKKMNYRDVQQVIDGNVVNGYEPFVKTLQNMYKLSRILKEKRNAIPFDSKDISYTFDENKNIIDINKQKNNDAMNIIEEFMILANVCMANYSTFLSMATPYRIHEVPDAYKVDELFNQLKLAKYDVNDCIAQNLYETLNNILRKYQNSLDYPYISNLILKTMKRAKYSNYNEGHYALKENYYAHFTSPIRRFPDLLLHYQIHTVLDKTYPDNTIGEKEMEELCSHASFMEQAADQAEKEADEYTVLRYMKSHPEKIYRGYIDKLEENYISIVISTGIKGRISYQNLSNELTIDQEKGAIYFHKNVYLKTGNVCLFQVKNIDLSRNEVELQLEKNLSVREYDKDFSRILKKAD